MDRRRTIPQKHVDDSPSSTLEYLDNDDSYVKSLNLTETTQLKKNEKSVRFEDDGILSSEESVETLNNSNEIISWIPSEHLYSEDTFIADTQTDTKTFKDGSVPSSTAQTTFSYGSNTFIEESEEEESKTESVNETKTGSEYSYTAESLSSTDVFSSRGGDNDTYREWRDVTEIVKDIDELEESQLVTRVDLDFTNGSQATDLSDSLEEEMAEEAKHNFLTATLRRLRLVSEQRATISKPRNDKFSVDFNKQNRLRQAHTKDHRTYCTKMIERCKKVSNTRPTPLPKKAQTKEKEVQFLENFGLSSALVNKIKIDNLCQRLQRKADKLDEDTEKSLKFLKNNQGIEEEIARQKFISYTTAQVQHCSTSERIQSHLLRTHPVKCFADFVVDLPRWDEDSREILYKYKRLLEKRKEED